MSVKQMTSDQLRADLRAIALTFPEGIPWQQVDRVNALRGELKRRGESPDAPAPPATQGSPTAATTEELEAELRTLSTRNDEESQKRFADVRYELRRRAKAEDDADSRPKTSPVNPRALEMPSDEEVQAQRLAPPAASAAIAQSFPKVDPDRWRSDVVAAQPASKAIPRETKAAIQPLRVPVTVAGFTAAVRSAGVITLEYEVRDELSITVVTRVMTVEAARNFISMITEMTSRAEDLLKG